MEPSASVTTERDMALAMHETFLGSGSEDAALSPRFQNFDIRSSPSTSPRTPKPALLPSGTDGNANSNGSRVGNSSPVSRRVLPLADRNSPGSRNPDAVREAYKSEPPALSDESFVRNLVETEFGHHEKGVARLNNGSFGACPKSVQLEQERLMREWVEQPDKMYYGPLDAGLLESRQLVAARVNCPVDEVVLVDNVTTGAAMVAQDFMWELHHGRYQPGDAVLLLSCVYLAVRRSFEAYAVRAGARILVADLPFPVASADEIVRAYEAAVSDFRARGAVIRLAVIDHVASMPSMVLPVRELVGVARRHGVAQVFVDGAQGIGNVPIDVVDIGADFYAGNIHKWGFAPTCVGFLHCRPEYLGRLHHPIVSWHYGKGLAAECAWIGTRDYSAMLALRAAFSFAEERLPGGWKAVREHNHERVLAAATMLAEAWGTFCGVAPQLCSSMAMVGLPPPLALTTHDRTLALRTRLRREFSVEVHTFTPASDKWVRVSETGVVSAHLRISHQIYNTWDEYLRLRDAVNAIVAERAGEIGGR